MSEEGTLAWIRALPDGSVLLRVHVQPKASRSEWVGVHEDRIKLRIAAPPVEGEANEEVVRFVRKSLKGVGVREVVFVRGEASKQKDLALRGAALEAIRAAIQAEIE